MAEINYDLGQQWILNGTLALMVLGISLDVQPRQFLAVLQAPKAVLIALVSQFLLLPAFTFFLTLMLELPAGIELGMILVAACPGGALSNFITHLSGGNTALSMSVTAISSSVAVIMLPVNFLFWASLNPIANELLIAINVESGEILKMLLLVLAIPLVIGFLCQHYLPKFSQKLHVLLKYLSVLILFVFIAVAVVRNYEHFITHFWLLFAAVLMHNALALSIGYLSSDAAGLSVSDKKAITLEVGMQNSSLAIAIVFTQFNAEYGMALISAFWGTWHIVSGLAFALLTRSVRDEKKAQEVVL